MRLSSKPPAKSGSRPGGASIRIAPSQPARPAAPQPRRPAAPPQGRRPTGLPGPRPTPAPGRRPSAGLFSLVIVLLLLLTPLAPALAATEEAVLAGGCFWCLEHDLEDLPGVLDVESGYSGGKKPNPTYQEVSAGGTGYQESVRVRFDNTKLRYEALLRAYWRNIDPLDGGGQFCDRGDSYRPVIFTTSATQAVEARNSLVAAARELGKPTSSIKVMVRTLSRFWPAENYHQNYAKRNGLRYRYYRWACRRDQRLDAVWGPQARRGVRWLNGVQAAAGHAAAPAPAPATAVAKPAPAAAAKPTAAAKPAPAPAPAPTQVPAAAAKPTAAAGPAPGSAGVVAGAAPSSPAAGRPAAAAGASGAGAAPGSPGGSAS